MLGDDGFARIAVAFRRSWIASSAPAGTTTMLASAQPARAPMTDLCTDHPIAEIFPCVVDGFVCGHAMTDYVCLTRRTARSFCCLT